MYKTAYHDNHPKVVAVLEAIKYNDGFPGPVDPAIRAHIIGRLAYPEISPLTGMDMEWKLTTEGKQWFRSHITAQRRAAKMREHRVRNHNYQRDAVVPLTIEVLDALKAIRETGDPQTNKLDILARIQRYGTHAARTVKDNFGKLVEVSGSLAEYKDGVWTLTDVGKRVEAGHIRKSECAQFTGKVR